MEREKELELVEDLIILYLGFGEKQILKLLRGFKNLLDRLANRPVPNFIRAGCKNNRGRMPLPP
jgi:hypothetical protein